MLVELSRMEVKFLRERLGALCRADIADYDIEWGSVVALLDKLEVVSPSYDEEANTVDDEDEALLFLDEYDEENDREIRRPLDEIFPGD